MNELLRIIVPSRIALNMLEGSKESVSGCAFAAGETADAPDCSAALVLSTCLAQFERESARGVCDTGRYRMPYRIWGRGPALIVSPGLCDDAEAFVLLMARLSQRYCCIAYDLPTGVGDGARLSAHSHADLVQDLFALADHLRLDSAMLLGASFGSTMALSAMARAPQRFPIGLLQGGFAKRPLAPAEVLLARFARYWPGQIGQLPFWLNRLQRLHAAEFAALEPARWPFFLEHHAGVPIAAVAHRALLVHQVDVRALLPTIRQPVMMICGEHDPLVDRACEDELRAGLPNVARAEIEGCGHLPHFTHPEVLCEAIEQFLAACRGEQS
jgi:pimeloyl-ACP methyl ester carboxylesterase